ncbi:MAG: hypothetical protein ACREMA_01885 [Longimicrobiales bacterium]
MLTSSNVVRAPLRWCLLALALLAPRLANAQMAWEAPQMLRPGAPAGWSILAFDYGLDPFDGRGAGFIYRAEPAPAGIGLRGSVAMALGDKLNYAGGFDVSRSLLRASDGQFPVDLMLSSGLGGSYGEYIEVAVPVTVSGGRSVSSGSVRFNPYAGARGVLEGRFGEAAPTNDVSLALVVDLGIDLAFGRSRNFLIRTAVSLGDRHALALGVNLGGTSLSSARVAPLTRD